MIARMTLTLCAALALAACGSASKKETGGTAGGEILPASVSDSMLPYDTARSQAPLAPSAEGGKAAKSAPASGSSEPAAAEPESEPAEPAAAEPAEAE